MSVSGVLFLSRNIEGGCGRIGPRQELVEATLGMAGDDAADHVSQVGPRLDADEVRKARQCLNESRLAAALISIQQDFQKLSVLVPLAFCHLAEAIERCGGGLDVHLRFVKAFAARKGGYLIDYLALALGCERRGGLGARGEIVQFVEIERTALAHHATSCW